MAYPMSVVPCRPETEYGAPLTATTREQRPPQPNRKVRKMTMNALHDAPDTVEVHGEKSDGGKLSIFLGILKRYCIRWSYID